MKKTTTILLLLLVGSLACTLQAQLRYAGRVHGASREYHSFPDGWAAFQLLGIPDVYPAYYDLGGAWTPTYYGDQRDWVELGFDNAGPVDSIYIWETYNPGFIDTVYVQNPGNGSWVPVYTHTASAAPGVSRILRIGFPMTNFNVSRVRIAVATDVASSYVEIDAVALHPASNPNLVLSNAIGTAVNLDGVDDQFQTNTPLENAFTSAFTLMAWVKPVGPANSVLYSQYGGGLMSDPYHSIFSITVANIGGGDSLYMHTLGSVSGVISMPYVTGNWMHIAMVQTADSLIAYRDGVRVRGIASSPPPVEYYSISLGRNDDGGQHFAGQIDEFKTFNRALSGSEVATQLNLIGYPAVTAGLTGYWQFNEGSGTGHYNPYNHITDSLLYGANYVNAGFVVGVKPAVANDFEVYPNPTDGQVFVGGDFRAVTQIQVMDITGMVVGSQKVTPTAPMVSLDLTHLPAGMYLLRMQGKQSSMTKKIFLK